MSLRELDLVDDANMNIQHVSLLLVGSNLVLALCCLMGFVALMANFNSSRIAPLRDRIGVPGVYSGGAWMRYLRQARQARRLLYCGVLSLLVNAGFLFLLKGNVLSGLAFWSTAVSHFKF